MSTKPEHHKLRRICDEVCVPYGQVTEVLKRIAERVLTENAKITTESVGTFYCKQAKGRSYKINGESVEKPDRISIGLMSNKYQVGEEVNVGGMTTFTIPEEPHKVTEQEEEEETPEFVTIRQSIVLPEFALPKNFQHVTTISINGSRAIGRWVWNTFEAGFGVINYEEQAEDSELVNARSKFDLELHEAGNLRVVLSTQQARQFVNDNTGSFDNSATFEEAGGPGEQVYQTDVAPNGGSLVLVSLTLERVSVDELANVVIQWDDVYRILGLRDPQEAV